MDKDRYIALLRGINISGKNRIPMSELQVGFEAMGYRDVRTYLNSGNVAFTAERTDTGTLAAEAEAMIRAKFGLEIPVYVIARQALMELLDQAPEWWGTGSRDIYDNLIFVLPGADPEKIAAQIGEPTAGLEQVCICEGGIFWSFDRARYARANWWKKTATVGIGEWLTIRTANTVRKLAGM